MTLLGANGAGKSTTLLTIAGLVKPSVGSIEFDGQDIVHMKPEDIVRHGIALTPEGRGIFAHLSVTDNLRIGAATRKDKAEVAATMDEMFELFPILRERSRSSSPARCREASSRCSRWRAR